VDHRLLLDLRELTLFEALALIRRVCHIAFLHVHLLIDGVLEPDQVVAYRDLDKFEECNEVVQTVLSKTHADLIELDS